MAPSMLGTRFAAASCTCRAHTLGARPVPLPTTPTPGLHLHASHHSCSTCASNLKQLFLSSVGLGEVLQSAHSAGTDEQQTNSCQTLDATC
jgi:hypothetical protein